VEDSDSSVRRAALAKLDNSTLLLMASRIDIGHRHDVVAQLADIRRIADDLIELGGQQRLPVLEKLLYLYGDVPLAEDYLNSGEPSLEATARGWAVAHNLSWHPGGGSHGASWGGN